MIDINLLAARRAQRQRAIALMRLAFYGLFGMALLIVLLYFWMTVQIGLVQGRITETEGVLAGMEKERSRVAYLESQNDMLVPKVAVLRKVHDSEKRWIEILRDIGGSVPASAGITQLSSKRVDRGQQLSLSGVAESERLIGAYMLALQPSEWCGRLQLVQAGTRRGRGAEGQMEFEMTIPLKEAIGLNLTAPAQPKPTAPAVNQAQAGEAQ